MAGRRSVKITAWPNLRQPVMVCGVNGWVDGGQAATGSVKYLLRKLMTTGFATMPSAPFSISQLPGQLSLRPRIRMEDGLVKEHRFPQNRFFYWVNPYASKDLIFFLGAEPNMNWEEYAETLLSIVEDFSVVRIYFLGGILDKTPHNREPDIFCSCSSPKLKDEMKGYGVYFSDYEGPGSFGSFLLYLCQQKDIQMVRLTTRSSYYPEFNVMIPRSPRAIRVLVKKLSSLFQLKLDLSDLDGEIEALDEKFRLMARQDPRFRAYIEELGKSDIAEIPPEGLLDISASEAVEIIEELLREEEN